MKEFAPHRRAARTRHWRLLLAVLLLIPLLTGPILPPAAAQAGTCAGPFLPVSTPLNDLGPNFYVRMDGQNTGEKGGLYPAGSNQRPPAHEAAGVAIAGQVVPLDSTGHPDPANGDIVMISIGMSNAASEFATFIRVALFDPDVNPQLSLVNGAQPGKTSPAWVDPNSPAWQEVDSQLAARGLTPAQVQVAWVKLAQVGPQDFPAGQLSLQADLAQVARNLTTNYPNIRLAYISSRTRSYTYWQGLSPEPSAFESGFSVKWLIEDQIDGDPTLNYDRDAGPVVAPFLSWGAYLWIDGLNPRSDGMVWLPEDLADDCTHPSDDGQVKVANMLLSAFKTDTTAAPWFTIDGLPATPTATPNSSPTPTLTGTPSPSATPAATATPPGRTYARFMPSIFKPAIGQPAGPPGTGSDSGPGLTVGRAGLAPARLLLNNAFFLWVVGIALLVAGLKSWLRP